MNSFCIVEVVKVDSQKKVGQVQLITSANKFTNNWKKNQKNINVYLNLAVFLAYSVLLQSGNRQNLPPVVSLISA